MHDTAVSTRPLRLLFTAYGREVYLWFRVYIYTWYINTKLLLPCRQQLHTRIYSSGTYSVIYRNIITILYLALLLLCAYCCLLYLHLCAERTVSQKSFSPTRTTATYIRV